MRRGRPVKYPRPDDCPHLDRPEHANGVCYQCSSNLNNQRKREKAEEELLSQLTFPEMIPSDFYSQGEAEEPPKKKKKKESSSSAKGSGDREEDDLLVSQYVEINVGGRVFSTTVTTLSREYSLLTLIAHGSPHPAIKYEENNRAFIDRDPKYFRWILNYLRDGYLVTVPSSLQDRLEILQEARYYQLHSLAAIIANPQSNLHNHPITQVVMPQTTFQEKPSFLNARPSTKGMFYLSDIKWSLYFGDEVETQRTWSTIAVRFEESSEEVTFLSLTLETQIDTDGNPQRVLTSSQEVARTKLLIDEVAKAIIDLSPHGIPHGQLQAEFWWEPSHSQYPQLYARFVRGEINNAGPMDFLRTVAE